MKKSKYNYKIYNGKAIKKLLENSKIYLLTLFFSVGIIIGASALKNINEFNCISEIINSYTSLKSNQGFISNFLCSFIVNSIFIIISSFLALSLIGYPLLMTLPIFKGLGMGIVCGYLYNVYRFTGLGYALLIIYPGAIVSTFSFLLSCSNCCEYSKNAYLKAIQGRGHFEKDETKVFIFKQLIFLCICAVSAAIDTVFTKIFSSLFEI